PTPRPETGLPTVGGPDRGPRVGTLRSQWERATRPLSRAAARRILPLVRKGGCDGIGGVPFRGAPVREVALRVHPGGLDLARRPRLLRIRVGARRLGEGSGGMVLQPGPAQGLRRLRTAGRGAR